MASDKRRDNKGRLLRKGESQRKDGMYMYRWTDARGSRKCIYDVTLEGLRKQETEIVVEIYQGVRRENITLSEMIERYLAIKASLASSTYENYKYYYEHCIKNSFIGNMKVTDIRKSDLLLYYNEKSHADGLSTGTIHILQKIIHPALELALDDDIIHKNPANGCMKEYPQEDEIKYALTFDQEKEFLHRVLLLPRSRRYHSMFAIMLYTGIRISEALGLTWDDVDMENKTIRINHQLQYRRIQGTMRWYCVDTRKGKAGTKTKYGERIIPMTPKVYSHFVVQRMELKKMKNKDENFVVDGYKDFVFLSNRTGRPPYPSNIRRIMNNLVKMNDEREIQLPPISPHILRHTACTRYAESGMDIKTVQYLMGHSDVKTTIKVYNHTDLERAKRELQKYTKWQEHYTNFYTKTA